MNPVPRRSRDRPPRACFGRELRGNNVSNIKKVVNSNACIGKAYFEEIFSERISNMELLAKRISEQDLSNRGELAAVFEELNGYFDDISILDINGIRLYGNCLYMKATRFRHSSLTTE